MPDGAVAGGGTDGGDHSKTGGIVDGGQPPGVGEDGCALGAQVDFSLLGYATENGGTTGGKGGETVTVTNGTDLVAALAAHKNATTPLTILIDGTITEASAGVGKIEVKDMADLSLIGLGEGAEFDGIGIKVWRASNIVLRNLRIHHVLSGDKDAISIEGPSDHIWVDHCELSAELDGVDKDFYDGLLDAKGETEYLTYSWNYLHDSWKAMLVGSSESDTYDRKLTMHHNHIRHVNSRLPLFRGGTAHIFNNVYEDVQSTAVNSRLGACVRLEENVFTDVQNAWVSAYSDELGAVEERCNLVQGNSALDYSSDVHEPPACDSQVPYDYSAVINNREKLAKIVATHAGTGKLSDPTAY